MRDKSKCGSSTAHTLDVQSRDVDESAGFSKVSSCTSGFWSEFLVEAIQIRDKLYRDGLWTDQLSENWDAIMECLEGDLRGEVRRMGLSHLMVKGDL